MQSILKVLKEPRVSQLLWWLPLLAICIWAGWLRLDHLSHDLPANADLDEANYFFWGKDVRETGRPTIRHGAGYPPGFLYQLALEQTTLDFLKGPALDPSIDYFLFARVINGLFGVAGVALIGILGRRTSRSTVVGLACALFVAVHPLFVEESRRGAANAPWLFFTLLAFLFLYLACERTSLLLLYGAVAMGVVSFLYKYQSGVFLALPFICALIYFRKNARLKWHLGLVGLLLAGLLAWLIFDYHIAEIVHTPATDTASAFSSNELVGAQSIVANWGLLNGAFKSRVYMLGAVSTGLAALGLVVLRKVNSTTQVKVNELALYALFLIMFYLLMALFQPTAPSKWLAFMAVVVIMVLSGFWWAGNSLAELLFKTLKLPGYALVCNFLFLIYMGNTANYSFGYWKSISEQSWTRPYSVNLLNSWFHEEVPQGGRVITEANKILNTYSFAPLGTHTSLVNSIFDQPIAQYRDEGYEYLIWNSLTASPNDTMPELDARLDELKARDAQEVMRADGSNSWGPGIVVFKIPPIQQHPLYAWFSPAISFRGYDLNQETFKPGEEISLMLYWESAEVIKENYIVFVHVLDPNTGKLIAGQDGPPDYGNTPTWKWLGDMQFIRDQRLVTIPADAPPGTYTLSIGMYDADTQQRVQILDLQNQPIGNDLTLQEIKIQP